MEQAPRIKPIYPIYRLNDTVFRIGAQLGITAEFADPEGQFWSLVNVLDGRPLSQVVATVRAQHPQLSEQDILQGISLLDREGFVDVECPQGLSSTAPDDRFVPTINYFSHFDGLSGNRYTPHERLRSARVLLLGLGGGGSNMLTLLSAVGIGEVVAVDHDRIESANLGRQVLYTEADVGSHKAIVAARRLADLNSTCAVVPHVRRIESAADVGELAEGVDLVVAAIDEPPFLVQRYVNTALVPRGVPCVYGVSQITRGRVFSVTPGHSGCFDCMNIHYSKQDAQFVEQFSAFQRSNFRPPSIAYAPAMFFLASVVVDEAVRMLTRYAPPRSVGTQFEVDYVTGAGTSLLKWEHLPDDCPTCGRGQESDWKIFTHYAVETS